MISTVAGVAFELESAHPDEHHRVLVAEEDGAVVGTAQAGLAYDSDEPGQAFVNSYVLPGAHHTAAGLLRSTAEEYLAALGARAVYTWIPDDPAERAVVEDLGYAEGRSAHFLRLGLAERTLPERPPLPAGVVLRSAAEFAADPRPLFLLDSETTLDEPGDIGTRLDDYAQWLRDTWEDPELDRELTTVALVDGEPAAFSAARTDGAGRYSSAMTGTRRAFRGRGLARIVKHEALRKAALAGCTEAFTGNDTGNAPMLAVNDWFGYEVCATEVRYAKALGGA